MTPLVDELISEGYLKTDRIVDAFQKIDRAQFLPEDLRSQAETNIPLPIGYSQTISQPLTVAFMLELLDPKPAQVIMDVGSGSGWTTALLSRIVGEQGKIIAIERIPELCETGRKNADKFHFVKENIAEFYCQDGTRGFLRHAPYDRILVSAMAKEVPEELKEQLKIGGKMVIPVGNSLWLIEKKSTKSFDEEEFPGFSFVPLISKNINEK
jgi:protein-L-isoaspartate(D-aspartate) O-methyltransferase